MHMVYGDSNNMLKVPQVLLRSQCCSCWLLADTMQQGPLDVSVANKCILDVASKYKTQCLFLWHELPPPPVLPETLVPEVLLPETVQGMQGLCARFGSTAFYTHAGQASSVERAFALATVSWQVRQSSGTSRPCSVEISGIMSNYGDGNISCTRCGSPIYGVIFRENSPGGGPLHFGCSSACPTHTAFNDGADSALQPALGPAQQ